MTEANRNAFDFFGWYSLSLSLVCVRIMSMVALCDNMIIRPQVRS